jgi:hypothetical protein
MNSHYTIRPARTDDKEQIREVIRQTIALEKQCLDPRHVKNEFMEEFVDKVIAKGNMIIVENSQFEMEMIGEVHDYFIQGYTGQGFRELSFISRLASANEHREIDLINWLFKEIQERYQDVFRVELTSPVVKPSSVEYYKSLGMKVDNRIKGRFYSTSNVSSPMVPLSWMNPSFN